MDFLTDSAILKNTSVLVRDILCSNLQNRMMPHSFLSDLSEVKRNGVILLSPRQSPTSSSAPCSSDIPDGTSHIAAKNGTTFPRGPAH